MRIGQCPMAYIIGHWPILICHLRPRLLNLPAFGPARYEVYRMGKVERHRHIEEIFHAVLKLEPGQRESFLSSACASDPSLRSEIEELVSAHERAGSFLNLPAHEVAAGPIENRGPGLI